MDSPNLSAIGAPPRVLALLAHELRTQPTGRQRTNMLYALEYFSDIVNAHAEHEDVKEFLQELFRVVQTESMSPAPVGFTLLCKLFNGHNPLTPQLLQTLRKLAVSKGGSSTKIFGAQQGESLMTPQRQVGADDTAANIGTTSTNNNNNNTTDVIVTAAQPDRSLSLQRVLSSDDTRAAAIDLLHTWDNSSIPCHVFLDNPLTLHLYLPTQQTSKAKVYRDFAFCSQRPKLKKNWDPMSFIHLKTNIPTKSEIMYRILVEGYNYGVNAVVAADICGYTNKKWDKLGCMELYGWPEGWDLNCFTEYAPGASISQYYSSDGFVTVKLTSKSFFSCGFSVSAWLVCHGYGEGFPITVEVFHQNDNL